MNVKTKDEAARVLASVNGEKCFFCDDGTVCCNLAELVGCLEKMTAATYNHHVTLSRNDFINWVRDVLGDDKLASDLSTATDSIEAAKKITERINWLRKTVAQRKVK